MIQNFFKTIFFGHVGYDIVWWNIRENIADHTGAIDIYKRTGSIEKLKAAMGHSNVMVSLTYLRGLDVAELKEEDMPKLI